MYKRIRRLLRKRYRKYKEYMEVSESAEIGRRYFATNAFDGILTVLGILFGGYVGGLHDASVIVVTGLGASVAMGISGFWGTYEAEKAERMLSLKELERQTLSKLKDTSIGKAARFATVYVSFIDGIAPFIFALLVISPFMFLDHLLTIQQMYFAGGGLAFFSLATLGMYLGSVSNSSMIKSGLRMVLAGVVCGAISLLVLGGHAV